VTQQQDEAPSFGAHGGEQLAVAIARAYYLDDESKVDIAQRFGISRFQVARLLQRARDSGMVHIEIRSSDGVDVGLSDRLATALGIARAWVVDAADGRSVVDVVGAKMADTLADAVRPGDVVGMSWSRALVAMARHLDHLASCTAVQLAGHGGVGAELPDGSEVVRQAARVSGGTARPIPAPLLVTDASTLASLLRQPVVAAATELFDALDVAAISIGAWMPGESTVFAAASERDRSRALELNVVGEINGRLFDRDGGPVESVIGDRVLGISLEQLGRAPRLIAGSFGAVRAAPVIAATRAGLVSELVVDRSLAEAVLAAL
jgi:DNA-binding transcriptional regulator LsrR (DeoR family)